MAERRLMFPSVTIGCDPEIFFEKDGKIIGAEKVIPKEGLCTQYSTKGVVLDGVQAEIHTPSTGCRQSLGIYLQASFYAIRGRLQQMEQDGHAGVSVSFAQNVEVDQDELDSLSEECKMLGCMPSENVYGFRDLGVDPKKYRMRSAGGHIHLGLAEDCLLRNRSRLVPMLDAILGNFCVMLDRDPLAATRRKVYGRAGEYRTPSYGLEYRTLSNFWLRSYVLESMVFALARFSLAVSYTSIFNERMISSNWTPEKELFSVLDVSAVQRAIDTNDAELAKKNWGVVQEWLNSFNFGQAQAGFWLGCMPNVNRFLQKVEEKGLDYWFPREPMDQWLNLQTGNFNIPQDKIVPFDGWENFINYHVQRERDKGDGIRPEMAA